MSFQISDPLIKIIPPYRHRAESSCSSGSGGGGGVQRAVTPKLGTGNICSGDNSGQTSSTSSPHFNSSELLQNTSIGSSYGSVKLATTTSSSGTATSFPSSLRAEGPAIACRRIIPVGSLSFL
uniref:Uncharacterized protein n=1 Tax=Brugia malayi TaxID=6279 RepID=A8P8A7_BRUMA